jgi:single-strand DNA-binding protein
VCNFSIACTEKWRDKQGQKQERTTWVDLVAWGKLGEICGKYLIKGSKVFVQGRYEKQIWDDRQTGEKKSRAIFNLTDMKMLDSKREGGAAPSSGGAGGGFGQFDGDDQGGFGGGDDTEDDIPF